MGRLLRLRDVAKWLDLSDRKVWQLAVEGELQSLKLGRARRFDPVDVEAYIERQKNAPKGRGRHS